MLLRGREFRGNYARHGGAIGNPPATHTDSWTGAVNFRSAVMVDTLFDTNQAATFGGAVFAGPYSAWSFANCTMRGGAAYMVRERERRRAVRERERAASAHRASRARLCVCRALGEVFGWAGAFVLRVPAAERGWHTDP